MKKANIIIILFMIFLISQNSIISANGNDLQSNYVLSQQTDIKFLFIHHSVGSNWLSQGQLRSNLTNIGVDVHDATYVDDIGQNTDVCHWYPKFRDHFNEVRTFDDDDQYYTDGSFNNVVMFKSCYPNSDIVGYGTEPGDPESCTRTMANYKATYNALLPIFKNHTDMLFIPVTAPPLNVHSSMYNSEHAALAREFNNWLKTEWAPNITNVAVFDLFDVLADPTTNGLRDEYASGTDSHPTAAGSMAATVAFMPFFQNALDRWINGTSTTSTGTNTNTNTNTESNTSTGLQDQYVNIAIAGGIITLAVIVIIFYRER